MGSLSLTEEVFLMRYAFRKPELTLLARIARRHRSMMAYLDAQNLYSDAQALTVTAPSTNTIDHGQDRNVGIGEPLAVVITVDVGAAGGGTLTIALQSDDNAAFASPATPATTIAIPAASLTAGAQIVLPVPPDTFSERFTRLNYTLATMTGITVTAFMAPFSQIQLSPSQLNAQQFATGVTIQ